MSLDPAAHFGKPPQRFYPRPTGLGFDGWFIGERELPAHGGTASAYVDTRGYVRLVCVGPPGRRGECDVRQATLHSYDDFDGLIRQLDADAALCSLISELPILLAVAREKWPPFEERLPYPRPDFRPDA